MFSDSSNCRLIFVFTYCKCYSTLAKRIKLIRLRPSWVVIPCSDRAKCCCFPCSLLQQDMGIRVARRRHQIRACRNLDKSMLKMHTSYLVSRSHAMARQQLTSLQTESTRVVDLQHAKRSYSWLYASLTWVRYSFRYISSVSK